MAKYTNEELSERARDTFTVQGYYTELYFETMVDLLSLDEKAIRAKYPKEYLTALDEVYKEMLVRIRQMKAEYELAERGGKLDG